MARRVDLIDQFTELVVGAGDPRRLAERTLEVVMSLLNGVPAPSSPPPTMRDALRLARDRPGRARHRAGGLDGAEGRLPPGRDLLRARPRDRAASPATVAERPGPASFAIVPVLEDEALLALLYVDSQEPHFCDAHDSNASRSSRGSWPSR